METTQLIADTRQLLREGETGKAFTTLIAGLENNPRFPNLLRTLRLLEANFANARQQELKGLLSFSEAQRAYAKSNDAVLAVLDDLAAGRDPKPPAERKSYAVPIGVGALVIALVTFFVLRNLQSKPDCPDFNEGKKTNVLIFPFQNLENDMPSKPHIVLFNRIRELTQKNNLSVEPGVLTNYDPEKASPDPDDAAKLGQSCMANLIVWGQYSPPADAKDSLRVTVQYRFVDSGTEGSTDVLALKDITDLQKFRSGQMVKGLDDVIFSLCSMIAAAENRPELVKKWLGKVKEKDAADVAMMAWAEKVAPPAPAPK